MAAHISMTPNLLKLSCFVGVRAFKNAENIGAHFSNSAIRLV